MTTLLSAVVVVLLAANGLNAVSPVIARAADNCLARSTASVPDGSHWHDQINRITHRKCWVLASAVAPVGDAGLPGFWSNLLEPAFAASRPSGAFGFSAIDLAVPVALRDDPNSGKTGDPLFRAERPLYLTLLVFLASLGGALILCGLIGIAFLYLRSRPLARRDLPAPGHASSENTANRSASGEPSHAVKPGRSPEQ
jgi:hypothetical protein